MCQQTPDVRIKPFVAEALQAHAGQSDLPVGPVGIPIRDAGKIGDRGIIAALDLCLGLFEQQTRIPGRGRKRVDVAAERVGLSALERDARPSGE